MLQIYNQSMERTAYLENAFNIGYTLEVNSLWTASFALPAKDPKNALCNQLNYVEIFDGEERIDLFRIVGQDFERSNSAVTYYNCEHVLATLMNDVLFQYHQIGGLGTYTTAIINYILGKQSTTRWVLGTCSFAHQFEYNFENENLLSALFAVPQCFPVDYLWQWNTTVYPWTLSLVTPVSTLKSEIRYGKNMTEIKKTTDSTGLANRIYALGYGEGVNQLTISSVNSGVPYVQDAGSIAAYGLCPTILVDARYENAETLKAYAQQILSQTKDPYISYEISAIDLHRLTGDAFSRFRPGEIVRIADTEDGITVRAMIYTVEKSDVTGDPGAVTVTIANKAQDITSSISDLQSRTRITETYAQGATNLAFVPFADNADSSHPATFKFYIPSETVRINKVQLTVEFEPFRAYSQSAAAGGGDTATSSTTEETSESSSQEPLYVDTGEALNWESGANGHDHGIPNGTRLAKVNPGGTTIIGDVGFVVSGQHSHAFWLDAHYHTFKIPAHGHSVPIPDHVHDLTFGIYEGTTGGSATIKVDGTTVTGITDYSDIDIVSYLSVDGEGKIQRGTWHEVEITPNQMSRIVGSLFIQLFTNSRGGGDY